MSDVDRHSRIVEMLRDRPFASVRDIAASFGISAATARRDIDKLDELKLARKVYGGVSAIDGVAAHGVFTRTYSERSDVSVAAKRAIAAYAATMVQDGDSVIVHSGSTCFQLGAHLADRNIRLCTNSMPLAALLGEQGSCMLTITGGELHREPRILHASAPPPPFYASKFFLSAQGLDQHGLLDSHPLLSETAKRFADHSDRIVALVDSSKLKASARKLMLPWSRVDTLVTDDGIAAEDQSMIEARGVQVFVVPSDASRS